jgi:glutamate racemase
MSENLASHLAPIGVFDSGVGGLSVLRAIRHALPHHPLIYVADTAHAPYGDRSADYIQDRANHIAGFLVRQGAQALVVACNTASVHACKSLRAQYSIPVVAIEPAIKPAAAMTKTGVIGVLATSQTLASASVARLCATYGSQCRILLQPCPGLADQVDRGELHSPATRALLQQYLAPLQEAGVDVIVLGCTHYPFLRQQIQTMVGPDVTLLDPAAAVAAELLRRLPCSPLLAGVPDPRTKSEVTCFTSGSSAGVASVMAGLWGDVFAVQQMP